MAENEIPLEITAETKEAQKQIEAFLKAIQKATESLSKDFKKVDDGVKKTTTATDKALKQISGFASGVKIAFGAAIAFLAGREIINAFSKAIAAASEADQAVAKLNLALASTGDFSEEASKAFQEYAVDIQRVTTLSDEAVLAGISLAKTFGITNKEAANLVDAAIELAAATGTDLDTAINTLGKSLTGNLRELKKLGPEFTNLTEAQLKAGGAIDLVSKRFDGFAEGLTKTFGGAVSQLGNNFDDLFESIGKIVTQNPVVIATINALSKTFSELSKFLDANNISLSQELSIAIKLTLNLILSMIKGVTALVLAFEQLTDPVVTTGNFFLNLKDKILGTNSVQEKLKEQVDKINSGYVSTGKSLSIFTDNLEKQIKEINKVDNAAKPATKAVNNFGKSLQDAGNQKDLDKVKGSFDKIKNAIQPIEDEINKQTKSVEELARIEIKRAEKLIENAEKELKGTNELTEENKKLLKQYEALIKEKSRLAATSAGKVDVSDFFSGNLSSGFGKFFDEFIKNGTEAFSKLEVKETGKFARSLGVAVASAVGSGVISAIDTFAGVMKGVITGEFLRSGLEFAKEIASFPSVILSTVREFDAVFKDLATNLPHIISAVVSKLPEIFTSLVSSIGDIVGQLTERMPEIIKSLIDGLNKFINVFIETAPEFAKALANGVADIIDSIAARLPELLQAAGKALENIVSVLFERVIPTIARALPTIIKESLKTLTNVITIILESLPDIIKSFTDTAGEFVKAIVDAIPGIVEAFANNADEIVLALVEGVIASSGDIIAALINSLLVEGGLERIIGALLRAQPKIAVALVQGILRGLSAAAVSLGQAIGKAFLAAAANVGQFRFASIDELKESVASFPAKIQESMTRIGSVFNISFDSFLVKFQSIFNIAGDSLQEKLRFALTGGAESALTRIREVFPELINNFSDKIRNVFTNVISKLREAISSPFRAFTEFLNNFKFPDIGGGGAAKKLKLPKFAEGGLVPEGFPNDSFPARLTSGELIIPRDLVGNLSEFLADKGKANVSSGSDINSALLAKIAGLLAQPMQVQTTAEVNGRALANIILDLSRNNARLIA